MTKKIIAIVLALVCVASVCALAACGKKDGGEATTLATTQSPDDLQNEYTAAPTTASVAQTETQAIAADEKTAFVQSVLGADADLANLTDAQKKALEAAAADAGYKVEIAADGAVSIVKVEVVTTVPGETTTTAPLPQTKEEIVAYYNKVANAVKTDAKSIKHHYAKITLNGSTTLPGWADGVLKVLGGADKFIGDQLAKNSKGETTYTGADIKAHYPVEGETYASKLTAADVSSATLTEKDGLYTIVITTVADGKSGTVKHGEGHAPKAFNVVLPGVVNDNIPGVAKNMVGTAEMNYPASTVTVVVDAASGHILGATYDLKWTINFGEDIILPFNTNDKYSITY